MLSLRSKQTNTKNGGYFGIRCRSVKFFSALAWFFKFSITCTSKRKTMRVKTQFSEVWKIKTRIPVQKLLPFRRSRKLNAFSLQICGCGFPDSLKLSYTKILILLMNKKFLFGNAVAVIIYKATCIQLWKRKSKIWKINRQLDDSQWMWVITSASA